MDELQLVGRAGSAQRYRTPMGSRRYCHTVIMTTDYFIAYPFES